MSGFGYSDWSYDPFEKMVIFPPDPLAKQSTLIQFTGTRLEALFRGRWDKKLH